MTRIFDEKFEGAGYEEAGAIEQVGAGCTVDEDADSADAGSPSGWGSQCLKLITLSGVQNNVYWEFGPKAITHFRFSIVPTAESFANDQGAALAVVYSDVVATVFVLYLSQDGSGNLKFFLISYHDGAWNKYVGFPTLSLDTRYRVEVKWDATNDHWAWKIDGVNQPNDQDASDPVTTEGNLTSTHPTDTDYIILGNSGWDQDADTTICYDLIAIDDADWVGTESEPEPSDFIPQIIMF